VAVKTTDDLWGVEGNIRYPICCGCDWKVDFLGGFRFLQLEEGLMITENLNVPQPLTTGVGNIIVVDNFHTRNEFYGGQIGIDAEWRWRRWFLGGTGKLAIGDMHQMVDIDGATTFVNGPNPGTARGGFLALPGANLGTYTRDTFAVVPELGLKVGFYLTERLRFSVGYSVLYASSVVRPGDQIDTNINPSYIPRNGPPQGPVLPAFAFKATDFYAQGVNFALEWRY
jgi:Putative beta barrel porin-7 (BBP7)